MKVLVVEDDPFVRKMAVTGMEDAGFEAIEAASGSEAHISQAVPCGGRSV